MSIDLVDPDIPVPLHHQINLVMRDRIKSGHYVNARALPSEHLLAKEFGVSRITVSRALQDLAEAGLLRRRRGAGTEVIFRRADEAKAANLEHLLHNVAEMAASTSVKVLEFGYVAAPREVSEELGLAAGSKVQRAVRVRAHDDVPFSYLISYIPEAIGRSFTRRDMQRQAIHRLMAQNGHTVASALQRFSAVLSEAKMSTALDVTIGAPLLKIDRAVFDAQGAGLEYIHIYYVSKRYRHTLRLNSDKAGDWADNFAAPTLPEKRSNGAV